MLWDLRFQGKKRVRGEERYFQNDKDEQILPAMRIMKDSTVTISIIWDL